MIEACFVDQSKCANGLKKTQSAESVGIGGIFSRFKAHLHMTLGRQIVNLIRLNHLHQAHNIAAIGHVAIMHKKLCIFVMRVGINTIDALGVERRGAPFHAMNFIAFLQQKPR